jgi:hypothetical protein
MFVDACLPLVEGQAGLSRAKPPMSPFSYMGGEFHEHYQ